jgi:hypothetical protein
MLYPRRYNFSPTLVDGANESRVLVHLYVYRFSLKLQTRKIQYPFSLLIFSWAWIIG